jgi:phosphatidylglycerophosphatase A
MERGTKLKVMSGGKTMESIAGDMISTGDRGALAQIFPTTVFDLLSEQGIDPTMENVKKQDQTFWDEVTVRLAGHILRTQPSGTQSAVSEWKGRSRNSIVARILTRYGSQASRMYNNVIDAVEEHGYEGTKESRKQMMKVIEAQLITNTIIMSTIKATRRATKVAFLLAVFGATMSPEDKEEMEKKKDEEIDEMMGSWIANAAKSLGRTVEGVDELIGVYDFFTKSYRNEPFGGVATSEFQEMKRALMAYNSMKRIGAILDSGIIVSKEHPNGRRMNRAQRKVKEAEYERAVTRFLVKSRNTTLFLARIPSASLADVDLLERNIAGKVADRKK